MTLLTRCPGCTKLYQVVVGSLRTSQGMAICGSCDIEFDATLHLIEVSLEPEADAEPAIEPNPPPPSAVVGASAAEATAEVQPEAANTAEISPDTAPSPSATSNAAKADEATPNPTTLATESNNWPKLDLTTPELSPLAPEIKPSEELFWLPEATEQAQNQSAALSFVPAAKPRPRQRYQWLWRALVLVLALLLVVQWLYHERNRLAAAQPQWRSALQALCQPLGCKVAAWQQIESISVEAVAFKQQAPGWYRLSFTVKNNSSLALAAPSIELTLSNAQDEIVLRRVLTASDIAAPDDQLSASAELPVALNLQLSDPALAATVANYRLRAFYP